MALFKILKGKSKDLGNTNNTKVINEGFAYFTPEDGKFYIDVLNENEIDKTTKPVIGNYAGEPVTLSDGTLAYANRICINQKLFNYNDYDFLNCGGANLNTDEVSLIFNCGTSED